MCTFADKANETFVLVGSVLVSVCVHAYPCAGAVAVKRARAVKGDHVTRTMTCCSKSCVPLIIRRAILPHLPRRVCGQGLRSASRAQWITA